MKRIWITALAVLSLAVVAYIGVNDRGPKGKTQVLGVQITPPPASTTVNYGLGIDGSIQATVTSVEGCGVKVPLSGAVDPQPCKMQIVSPGSTLLQWIRDSIGGNAARKSVMIISYDSAGAPVSAMEGRNAFVQSVGVSSLVTSAKDPAKLDLTLNAEPWTSTPAPSGKLPASAALNQSSFRFTFDGADATGVSWFSGLNDVWVVTDCTTAGSAFKRYCPGTHRVGEISVGVSNVGDTVSRFATWYEDAKLGRATAVKAVTLTMTDSALSPKTYTITLRDVRLASSLEPFARSDGRLYATMSVAGIDIAVS